MGNIKNKILYIGMSIVCILSINVMPIYIHYIAGIQSQVNLFTTINSEKKFEEMEEIGQFNDSYKWVGGILGKDNCIYAIPTGETSILKINTTTKEIKTFGSLSNKQYKYTGGCLYKGKIYGFPRRVNTLLKITPTMEKVEEVPLNIGYR